MKAVILCRVSTRKEEQESSSDRQLARLEEVAHRRNWTVVARFEEKASGRTMRRRPIAEALELIRRKRADLIMVDHLFRFGRNAKEMLEAVDTLDQLGGALYEADRELDTTGPLGRLVFTIGEFYVRDGARKIREGQARARQLGKRIGRARTIDYGRTDEARSLKVGGASWAEVAKQLGGSPGAWSRRLSRAS